MRESALRPTVRIFFVVLLWLYFLVLAGPDLRRCFGHPLGRPDFEIDYNDSIVRAGPIALRAGATSGDRIDLQRASIEQRSEIFGDETAEASDPLVAPLFHDGKPVIVSFPTVAEPPETVAIVWVRFMVALLGAILATFVLLRTPSVATWAFFVFMLVANGAPINDALLLGATWWRVLAFYLWTVGFGLGPWGAAFFALHLLHPGPLPPWRRGVQAACAAFAAVSGIAALMLATYQMYGSQPTPVLSWIAFAFSALPMLLAPVLLTATVVESGGEVRPRLRWVTAGFAVAAICFVIDTLGSGGNLGLFPMSYAVHSLLVVMIRVPIALTVSYAVLKHRIIDVDVAISRATVYAVLSSGMIGIFALVDLFFTRALAFSTAGLIADVGLALTLGFSYRALHDRVDEFIDRSMFQARHRADEHLRSLADAMAFSRSEEHVGSMLVDDVVRTLSLKGGTLVQLSPSSSRELQTLAAVLESHRKAFRVSESQWNVRDIANISFSPALVAPIFSHGRLHAVAIYGAHKGGTDFDGDEITLIDRLAATAGAAFDRLEAVALRHEVESLRRQVSGTALQRES